MKKLILVFSLFFILVQPGFSFDLKTTFKEFTEGLKKIPDDIRRKTNSNTAKAKGAVRNEQELLKKKRKYIKNSDQRLKQQAQIKKNKAIKKQKEKLAKQQAKLNAKKRQLKNTPKGVKNDYEKLSKKERKRLEALLKY